MHGVINGVDGNKVTKNGATPMIVAAQNGHSHIVRLLLENRADGNKAANDGATSLFVAAHRGYMTWLICCSSIVRLENAGNKAANNGATPSRLAAQHGQ